MDKNKRIPKVRYKGFEDEWENMDASEIFKTYFDKNHPDLPVLSASQEYGMIVRENVGFNVQHNKENEAGYKGFFLGSLLFIFVLSKVVLPILQLKESRRQRIPL